MATEALPAPLVKLTRHPIRWTRNKVELVIAGLVLAHIGMLIVTGLYYGLFETWHPMTVLWHNTVSDSYTRHMLRDVGEGFLGGFLAQQVIWNHFRKLKPRLSWLDKLEIKLHIPNLKDGRQISSWQLLATPLLATLYAAPGFLVAVLIAKWFHHTSKDLHAVAVHTHVHASSYWIKVKTIWTGSWDKKLVGLGASLFFGRRPARAVFDDVQLYFVGARLIKHKRLRFYHPPTFKARYNEARSLGMRSLALRTHDTAVRVAFSLIIPIGVALTAFGYYVLTYIAH